MEEDKILYGILTERLELLRRLDKEGDSDKRRHIARETTMLHAPMAHRLGLYQIKTEMEDLALKFTNHDAYKYIAHALNEKKSEREAYIREFIEPLECKLRGAGFSFVIKGRPKSIHSIYHKMQVQHCDIDYIYDLFAIRIILDSLSEREKQDCWQVYSMVTDIFPPNPKRLRDWLSVPKENGYESLHTTVMGPKNKWVEVQIRSKRMDEVAEKGVAAHWAYKGVNGKCVNTDKQYVYVFTPEGDLRRLPQGACVLDFAYSIHSELASHCTGARIHGKFVPIRHVLSNGDQIEVLTSAQQHPTQDWLNFVVSHRAKNRIRQSLAKMEEAKSPEEYCSVADIKERSVVERISQERHSFAPQEGVPVAGVNHMALEVDAHLKGADINMATCCQPSPGMPIFGFISVSKGIRIHSQNCPNAEYMRSHFPYRIIKARWSKGDAEK